MSAQAGFARKGEPGYEEALVKNAERRKVVYQEQKKAAGEKQQTAWMAAGRLQAQWGLDALKAAHLQELEKRQADHRKALKSEKDLNKNTATQAKEQSEKLKDYRQKLARAEAEWPKARAVAVESLPSSDSLTWEASQP